MTKRIYIIGSSVAIVLAICSPALAADMPLKAPVFEAVYNWTGFYLGGHVGYGGGSLGPGTNPLPLQGVFFPHSMTGLIGGYQAGYNRQLPNNLVLGVEADVSFWQPVDRPEAAAGPLQHDVRLFRHGPRPRRIRVRNAGCPM